LNIHGAIVDEVHAHKTRELWDILETATGARRQPMMFAITTAGVSRESICRELHDYTEKVLEGSLEDDSHCGIIYTLDEADDWMDEKVWIKDNPNLKESVKIDDLRDKARKAKGAPSALNAFLRLHMNMWTQGETRWIDPDVWNACNGRTDVELLKNEPCYGGLDLSTTTDITAFVLKFPNTGDVLAWFWIPEDKMEERERRDRVPFSSWVRMGFVEATPGNVVDYEYVKAKIIGISREFKGLKEIGFDPWNATQIGIQLEGEGIRLADVGQGYKSLSPAAKELEREYMSGELKHGGNPVLRWMAANVVLEMDPAENIKPSKKKSAERIDGIVALCCALSRQIAEDVPSVYESRGMMTL
jgi:phage terminase large subunit-like protein